VSLTDSYIQTCAEAHNSDQLSWETFNFLVENFNLEITLFVHKPEPIAIQILESKSNNNFDFWMNKFNHLNKNDVNQEDSDYYYRFSGMEFSTNTIHIFTIKKSTTDVLEIFSIWQSLYAMLQNIISKTQVEISNNYGNLISQLLHDVQSLMDLGRNGNQELSNKVEYQKKVNKNLLFFIRDFDLFKSSIRVSDFIKDSLSMINEDHKDFNIEFENLNLETIVDIELFSIAFNEIIKNALTVTENKYSDIKISIFQIESDSPFLNYGWIIFKILNKGKEIPKDFLQLITKPFFTTHKQKGCSGFGLTNAEKIITAHGGKLEIKSSEGTEIRIYLPQPNNE